MKDKFGMVGTEVLSFSLPNSRGENVAINAFRNRKNVIIVLLRDIH
jgi:peroxiredoxin